MQFGILATLFARCKLDLRPGSGRRFCYGPESVSGCGAIGCRWVCCRVTWRTRDVWRGYLLVGGD